MNKFKIKAILYSYVLGSIGVFCGFEFKIAIGVVGIILLCNAFLLMLIHHELRDKD